VSEKTAKPATRTVTVEEAAQILGISRSAAYRCVDKKQIPVVRLGRKLKVPLDGLERLLAGEVVSA
jgi:excisionase family DNA binding protein